MTMAFARLSFGGGGRGSQPGRLRRTTVVRPPRRFATCARRYNLPSPVQAAGECVDQRRVSTRRWRTCGRQSSPCAAPVESRSTFGGRSPRTVSPTCRQPDRRRSVDARGHAAAPWQGPRPSASAERSPRPREGQVVWLEEAQAPDLQRVRSQVAYLLRLDEDLSRFYAAAAGYPELAVGDRWRLAADPSPTVVEDVVKTICTTNSIWSVIIRMVSASSSTSASLAGRDGRAARSCLPDP